MNHPDLSVILIIGDRRERAALSLKSVLEQPLIDRLEVVLLDCGADGAAAIPGSTHAAVRHIQLKPNLSASWVRAEGVRQASAPLVVFLEEHAWAMPGWAETILNPQARPWTAMGPEMNNGNPGVGLNTILATFYYPLVSAPAWPNAEVGHHNNAYKRDKLLQYGDQLDALICPEELLVWRLEQEGEPMYVEPAMKVLHFYETYWPGTWGINYLSHQGIEASYDAFKKRSFGQKLWRFLILPLSPWRRLLRLWQSLRRHHPENLPIFWRGWPIMLAANYAAALGGMSGLVFGLRDNGVQFLNNQINIPRIVFVDGQPKEL